LRALGIELPPAPPAVGDYTPTVIAGNLLFLLFMSGQLPWIAGDLIFKGKMGAELNIEQGYQAFRLSALNAISQLNAALGSLDRVKQIARLEGACVPGFHDQPKVARRRLAHRQSGIRAARPPYSHALFQQRNAARLRDAGGAHRRDHAAALEGRFSAALWS
jgi:hypothetical protein